VCFAVLNFLSIDNISNFSTPEISDQFSIFFTVHIQFSEFIIFKLWVVFHFLRNSLSSEEPNSFNFKIGLLSQNSVHGKRVLSEMVNSLQEAIHHVLGLEQNCTLTFIFVVVNEINTVSCFIVIFEEEFYAFSFLVLVIDKESLETEEIEWTRWESI